MANSTEATNVLREWYVTFRDPVDIWSKHPSYLVAECIIYLCTSLTLIHATRVGGRYLFLWLAIMIHGLTVETVSYMVPDIDNFWHGQSVVMFLERRLPLHVICLYPFFIYPASVAVIRMRLKPWVEPFAVGLFVVLIDLPVDIVGIKQLWWTWHDTDPNIYDRTYSVPWNSYYFHAAFSSSLTFLLRTFRFFITGDARATYYSSFFKEFVCSVLTGMFAMGIGILQFIPLYHPMHDVLGIHTQVCVLILLGSYFLIVWSCDRNPAVGSRSNSMDSKSCDILFLMVLISNASMFIITVFFDPATIQSLGIHETIGPCNEKTTVQTPIGKVLSKRKFLCVTDFDEEYFDFHCLPSSISPRDGSVWYTVCGTPYSNKAEYVVVIGMIGTFVSIIYYQLLLKSGRNSNNNVITPKKIE